jgi:hypothetical protein
MTDVDDAAILLLASVAEALASVTGPITAATASAAMGAVATVLRVRKAPITMQTLDAILALIQAVREDITS